MKEKILTSMKMSSLKSKDSPSNNWVKVTTEMVHRSLLLIRRI